MQLSYAPDEGSQYDRPNLRGIAPCAFMPHVVCLAAESLKRCASRPSDPNDTSRRTEIILEYFTNKALLVSVPIRLSHRAITERSESLYPEFAAPVFVGVWVNRVGTLVSSPWATSTSGLTAAV